MWELDLKQNKQTEKDSKGEDCLEGGGAQQQGRAAGPEVG